MADLDEVRELLRQGKMRLTNSCLESSDMKLRVLSVLQSIACSLLAIASVVADVEFEDEEE